ncbi:hypothetical protein KTE71_15775 [Burkholderia multivorans]|uniref:hypothetical protein n=1 Tax=Burkholderia multivorans TaxID=87883 RepID=UPI001C257043|nr:hypothetical protein [Burkholderia multivorans]MBU9388982.1 hypothetical protein [Burkholderia multivorans]MBY4669645.1 hypothetical protein [Burkholderia multivorans]
MTVTSTDFLTCAEAIANGGSEIDHRSAISRAYYSAYHAALEIADLHFPDHEAHIAKGEHQRLSDRFLKSSNPKARGVAYMLIDLKRSRHRADYALSETIVADDATQGIANARKIHAQLVACAPATPQASVSGAAASPGKS